MSYRRFASSLTPLKSQIRKTRRNIQLSRMENLESRIIKYSTAADLLDSDHVVKMLEDKAASAQHQSALPRSTSERLDSDSDTLVSGTSIH